MSFDARPVRIRQQCDTGDFRKALSNQEIAVAVHEEQLGSAVCCLAQCTDHPQHEGVIIVISDPAFEQVAKDVERAGASSLRLQKILEGRGDVGALRLQVQV